MSTTEKFLETILSSEFERKALVITVPNDYKETVPPQNSLSDLSQNTTPITEVKVSLHGSNTFLHDGMEN